MVLRFHAKLAIVFRSTVDSPNMSAKRCSIRALMAPTERSNSVVFGETLRRVPPPQMRGRCTNFGECGSWGREWTLEIAMAKGRGRPALPETSAEDPW